MPSYNKYARKVGLPRMVKCYTCKRSKEIEEFAPAEQTNLSKLMLESGHVPEDHGAQCKVCRNAPRVITCYACNRDLEESDFSRLQRRKDEPVCLRCIAWEETQQPGYTPTPLVNGHVSAEEATDIINRQQKTDADFYLDEDDELPPAQTSRPDASSINHLADKVSKFGLNAGRPKSGIQSSSSVNFSQGQSGVDLHKWVRNSRQDYTGDARSVCTASTTNTNETMATQKLGRGLPQNLTHREPRVGSSIPTISTATTVRDDRSDFSRGTEESFNAWDPHGVQHRRLKVNEESSATSNEASSIKENSGQSTQTSKWPRKSQQGEKMW